MVYSEWSYSVVIDVVKADKLRLCCICYSFVLSVISCIILTSLEIVCCYHLCFSWWIVFDVVLGIDPGIIELGHLVDVRLAMMCLDA